MNIKHVYLGGLTAKRGEDGFLRVKGLATDDTLDLDEQICDPQWLKNAMPAWMSIGNIREMHQSKAVGKALEMEQNGTGFSVEAKIVDADAALKVEEGIYTGYSIGIKGARVVKDDKAPGGRIVDGKIVEVSLVDRPANPSAVIEIAKSVGDDLVKSDVVAEMEAEEMAGAPDELYERVELCQDCFGTGKRTNIPEGEDDTCEGCNGTGKQPAGEPEDIVHNSPSQPNFDGANDDEKGTDADLEKKQMSAKEMNDLPDSDFAYIEPGGKKDSDGKTVPRSKRHFPINDAAHVRNALARAPQSPFGKKAMPKILAAAKKFGIEVSKKDAVGSLEFVITKAMEQDTWVHDPELLACVRDGLIELITEELNEFKTGDDERWDVQTLVSALNMFLGWWEREADEDETPEPFKEDDDSMAYIAMGVSADIIKAATAEDATDDAKAELRNEIVKALGLEEMTTTKAELGEAKEQIELLKAELSEVKSLAIPGGPAIRATREQTSKSAEAIAHEVEAQRFRMMAAQMTDPDMRTQYMTAALTHEAQAKSL